MVERSLPGSDGARVSYVQAGVRLTQAPSASARGPIPGTKRFPELLQDFVVNLKDLL